LEDRIILVADLSSFSLQELYLSAKSTTGPAVVLANRQIFNLHARIGFQLKLTSVEAGTLHFNSCFQGHELKPSRTTRNQVDGRTFSTLYLPDLSNMMPISITISHAWQSHFTSYFAVRAWVLDCCCEILPILSPHSEFELKTPGINWSDRAGLSDRASLVHPESYHVITVTVKMLGNADAEQPARFAIHITDYGPAQPSTSRPASPFAEMLRQFNSSGITNTEV
jgi:hypothetical protein